MTTSEFTQYIIKVEDRFKPEERLVNIRNIFIEKFGKDFVELNTGNIAKSILYDTLRFMTLNDVIGDVAPLLNTSGIAGLYHRMCEESLVNWNEIDLNLIPDNIWEIIFARAYQRLFHNGQHRNCPYIMVYFPSVTITNEYGASTTVKDLYMKVIIGGMGNTIELEGNRSTYTTKQLLVGYRHSHLNTLDRFHPSIFGHFCTGSGPINGIMNNLRIKYDEMDWRLYCYELNRLVSVESIAGTPYVRLESMSDNNARSICTDRFNFVNLRTTEGKKFLLYFLKNKLVEIKFNYIDGHYDLNVDFVKFVLDITRCYKEYTVNNPIVLYVSSDLIPVLIINNKFYYKESDSRRQLSSFIDAHQNQTLFQFKGEDVKLIIEDATIETADNEVLIVSPQLVDIIYSYLLILANNGDIIREELASNEQETGII